MPTIFGDFIYVAIFATLAFAAIASYTNVTTQFNAILSIAFGVGLSITLAPYIDYVLIPFWHVVWHGHAVTFAFWVSFLNIILATIGVALALWNHKQTDGRAIVQ